MSNIAHIINIGTFLKSSNENANIFSKVNIYVYVDNITFHIFSTDLFSSSINSSRDKHPSSNAFS